MYLRYVGVTLPVAPTTRTILGLAGTAAAAAGARGDGATTPATPSRPARSTGTRRRTMWGLLFRSKQDNHGRRARPAQSPDRLNRPRPSGYGEPGSGGLVQSGSRRGGHSARRRATSAASDGLARSRSERIGRPSGVPGTSGHGTLASASSQANPSSSEPSYSFVTR